MIRCIGVKRYTVPANKCMLYTNILCKDWPAGFPTGQSKLGLFSYYVLHSTPGQIIILSAYRLVRLVIFPGMVMLVRLLQP